MSIVTTVLNVAGIFAAVHLWVSYRIGARFRAAWLLPVFIACAGLEAAFITHRLWLDYDNGVALSDIARRSGLDLVVWPAIGLTCYHFRRLLVKRAPSKPRSSSQPSAHRNETASGIYNRIAGSLQHGDTS